jgi:hypothetical protein
MAGQARPALADSPATAAANGAGSAAKEGGVAFLIKSPRNFWTGVLYCGFGALAFWIARDYSFGSASRMGAGYFPTVLSVLLIVFGLIALLCGVTRTGAPLGRFAWKPALIVAGSTVAFAFLLERAGFIAALAALILGGASASVRFRFEWRAMLAAVALIAFCVAVFVKGLSLPMPLIGSWFGG